MYHVKPTTVPRIIVSHTDSTVQTTSATTDVVRPIERQTGAVEVTTTQCRYLSSPSTPSPRSSIAATQRWLSSSAKCSSYDREDDSSKAKAASHRGEGARWIPVGRVAIDVAKEMNLSETAFVKPRAPDAT